MDDLKRKTCCFTGHRIIPQESIDVVRKRTEIKIRELIMQEGVRYFGVGGAVGYDTLVAQILIRLRATSFPDMKVILV